MTDLVLLKNMVAVLSVAVLVLGALVLVMLARRKGLVLQSKLKGREELERELSTAIQSSGHFSLHGICYRADKRKAYSVQGE